MAEDKKTLNLELGQVIRIIAPENESLHDKLFLISYLDDYEIKLLNKELGEIQIGINLGVLNDETIEQIEILYNPKEKGYARQNNLIIGTFHTIEFGGDVPAIYNGEITDIENDMIEMTLYPSREKIYIDFEYKGLPKDLNIISIRPFEQPTSKVDTTESLKDKPDVKDDDKMMDSNKMADSNKMVDSKDNKIETDTLVESEKIEDIEKEIDIDDFDDLELNFDESEQMEKITEILATADTFQIEDEKFDKIFQEIEVSEKNKRFSIDNQVNDMLDDLLARISTSERNKTKINEINTDITRFKELRMMFSTFREDGTIEKIKQIHGENEYKSLKKNLLHLDKRLSWLIPIIKNKKKLSDVQIFEDSVNQDVTIDSVSTFITEYNKLMEMYLNDDIPSSSDNYSFIQQRLNNLLKPMIQPEELTDVISKVQINDHVETIVDNLENMQSSIVKNETINVHQYYNQPYITGTNILYKNPLSKIVEYSKRPIIENESIFIKGFIVMPLMYKILSKLHLSQTNIYKKVMIHDFLKFQNILSGKELQHILVDESFEKLELELTTKNPYEVSFKETRNFTDRENDNIYEKFLDAMLPSNEYIIKKMFKYNKDVVSYLKYIEELETFLIYPEDIHFKEYNFITNMIENNILNYIKILKSRENIYLRLKNFPQREADIFNKVFEKEGSGDIISKIKEIYALDNSETNAGVMKKIIQADGGHLMNILMSISQNKYYQKVDFDKKMKKEMERFEQSQKMEKEDDGDCKQYSIVKMYKTISELQDDNGGEVYYDREYDNTRYDIMEEFEQERAELSEEDLLKKVEAHLIKNVGVSKKDATIDATSMIMGKRPIQNNSGELAVLDLGEYEYRYYERKNNQWRLLDEFNDKMPDDTTFCNLKDKCFNINDKCSTMTQVDNKIQKKLLNDIVSQFSEDLKKYQKEQRESLSNLQKKSIKSLRERISRHNKNMKKKDDYMMEVSTGIDLLDIKKSPFANLRDLILTQTDIAKKYGDITQFVAKYCRPNEATNPEENVYWFYCIESDVPLLPTFFLELAEAFQHDNYFVTLEKIVKNRGILSDDGDKMVDKYSGYFIKYIRYDTSEGYDEAGYKIKSRDVMEEAITDKIDKLLSIKQDKPQSKLAIVVEKIISSMDASIGINLIEKHEFMITNILLLMKKNVMSKRNYEKKMEKIKEKLKKKGQTPKSYSKYYDENLMMTLISIYVITTQSAIPSIKTSKTYPGCIKSFAGYPLEDLSSKKNLMNYISCILLKIRGDKRPWTGLPNIRKLSSASSFEKLERFILKLKKYMDQNILVNKEISKVLENKRAYLHSNNEKKQISETFNLRKWLTFLPPLYKIRASSIKSLGESYKHSLNKSIQTGSKQQFDYLNKLEGKIKEYSFNIYAKVNEIISNKDKLFMTNSGIPFMENACCNDKNINTYDYFVESDRTIEKEHEKIKYLEELKDVVKMYQRSPYIFSELNTKLETAMLSDNISEETIYKAFIKYCKFNSGVPLDSNMQTLCGINKANFDKYDPIEKKISILKNENGTMWGKKELDSLMVLVHNAVKLDIDKTIKTKKKYFEELLKFLKLKTNKFIFTDELIDNTIDILDRFGVEYDTKKDDSVPDFILNIKDNCDKKRQKIKDFLKLYLSDKYVKSIDKFFDSMGEFNAMDNIDFMSVEDSTGVHAIDNIKTMVKDMCTVFPEIIINKVEYSKKKIPSHWGLTLKHINDMEKIIFTEMVDLQKTYNNKELNSVLKIVQKESENVILLLDAIPFYADIMLDENKKTVFNNEVTVILYKYLFLTTIELYIESLNKVAFISGEKEMEFDIGGEESKGVDEDLLRGRKVEIGKAMANLIRYYVKMFKQRKKILNFSKDAIMKNILKSKQKEKSGITERLKNLTIEQRKVENVKKNLKLGDWGIGQTKALFQYDENQYDKERDYIEQMAIMEKKAGIEDDVTRENREIYAMEHLEEMEIEMRENKELDLDMRDEGERDGEELW